MTSDKDHRRYLRLFAKEQSYKDRLLKLQSQKLIDDLKSAEEVKKIQELLADNKRKLEKLSKNNNDVVDAASLIKQLSYQVSDMQNQLIVHKRKLIAYREAAKKFKHDLDLAEERKVNFLEDIGMYDEYINIQSAVKLTTMNKASEKVSDDFTELSNNQKVGKQIFDELNTISHHSFDSELTETIEPETITVFTELDDVDDLSQIKGIGPKFEVLLNNEGIHTFEQIANWTYHEVKKRDKRLVFRGRIEREQWVEQAKELVWVNNANELSIK